MIARSIEGTIELHLQEFVYVSLLHLFSYVTNSGKKIAVCRI